MEHMWVGLIADFSVTRYYNDNCDNDDDYITDDNSDSHHDYDRNDD
jgi:hypothetical protein